MNPNISPNSYAQKQIADFSGTSLQNRPQQPGVSQTKSYTPLPNPQFSPSPGLPDDWEDLTDSQKRDRQMAVSMETCEQNKRLLIHLQSLTNTVNDHSLALQNFDSTLNAFQIQLNNQHDAVIDRNPTSKISLSGVPSALGNNYEEIVEDFITYIGANYSVS